LRNKLYVALRSTEWLHGINACSKVYLCLHAVYVLGAVVSWMMILQLRPEAGAWARHVCLRGRIGCCIQCSGEHKIWFSILQLFLKYGC
jgi:hypothetical protein